MKHFILLFALFAVFTSCKRNNGYTCDVYDTNPMKPVLVTTYDFKSKDKPSRYTPEQYAISKYNSKATKDFADSSNCRPSHVYND